MEENKIDELAMFHKRKRKRKRMILTVLTILFLLIAVILIGFYLVSNQKNSVEYSETSNIKYRVNLIENEFYKTNYLEGNVDVISSLIKDIDVEFKYNLNLAEELEYKYTYNIVANIELKEKNKTNLIYSDEQEVINKEQVESNSKRLEVVEKINISYNDYNDQINKLIELYKLDNTVSELSLSMRLNVINKATGERINKESNVMTIVIPLDAKTVEIGINENVKDNQGEIIIQQEQNENLKIYLILGIVVFVIGILTLIALIRYNSKTRGAGKMYEDELRKILFDYKSYIQKINTKIDYKAYKIIRVNSFNELMGMREEIQAPILMYTDENDRKTIFMIMKDDILFTYVLGAKLIKAQLIENSKKRKEGKKDEKDQ